ncbi:MAG: TRAP-type transport system large permease protein, partial [Candidatus Atribacteria bacterium]|nr:TRAP-type transport system large permease protein [Candidatus Atribacteria bacterium]
QFLLGISENPYVITGLIVLLLLVLGMFIDSTVLILLLTSILVPVMRQIGMDLVHFGVLMVITCATGLLTPPVGLTMYAVCSVMECSLEDYMRESWPFLIAMFILIATMLFFPQIVLFIPNLIFG